MKKKLDFILKIILSAGSIGVVLWLAYLQISSGYSLGRQHPSSILFRSDFHPSFSPKGGQSFCLIQYDNDLPSYYFDRFEAGDGMAVFMDPEACGFDSTYPFKLTNVHLYLYDPGSFIWPVEIKVNIKDAPEPEDSIQKPGTLLHERTFIIPADSGYDVENPQDAMNLTLDEVFCVNAPFFLEVIYTGGTEPSYPSLVMTDPSDRPDTNENWVKWKGSYVEWHDFWEPWALPGRAILRITGYPNAIDCNICWDWMPESTKAPGGTPDFDQYQFCSDSVALCGPTAVANCLAWLDAIPSISSPDSLIRTLCDYLHTDPFTNGGTRVDSIYIGLDSLFADYGLDFYAVTFETPRFLEMADSLKRSANIVLLLGLWQNINDTWHRIGGHYVSMAGACKLNSWVAISDPAVDNTEQGARGRILPPHEPHPEDHTQHNMQGFVSHDAYISDTLSVGPYSGSWRLKDFYEEDLPWSSRFEGLNFQPEQMQYAHAYDSTENLYAVVEYAIMILEKPTLVSEEEMQTPIGFRLFQSYPNPFNQHTVIRYSLSKSMEVTLVIYNILGQKVRTLVNRERQEGSVSLLWDGRDDQGGDLSSGIYFYQLRAGEFSQSKKMILLK